MSASVWVPSPQPVPGLCSYRGADLSKVASLFLYSGLSLNEKPFPWPSFLPHFLLHTQLNLGWIMEQDFYLFKNFHVFICFIVLNLQQPYETIIIIIIMYGWGNLLTEKACQWMNSNLNLGFVALNLHLLTTVLHQNQLKAVGVFPVAQLFCKTCWLAIPSLNVAKCS